LKKKPLLLKAEADFRLSPPVNRLLLNYDLLTYYPLDWHGTGAATV
jgi:hypothetical protein